MPYCTSTDLQLGNFVMPRFLTADGQIQLAADEINGQLGQRYKLPIVFDPQDPSQFADTLLLKTTCAKLATGNIFLAAAGGGSDVTMHAYGNYLVRNAREIIQQIVSGDIIINTTQLNAGSATRVTAPVIINKDAESAVDNFYDALYKNGLQPQPVANIIDPYWRRA